MGIDNIDNLKPGDDGDDDDAELARMIAEDEANAENGEAAQSDDIDPVTNRNLQTGRFESQSGDGSDVGQVADEPSETRNVFDENDRELMKVARAVLDGKWGTGQDKRQRLADAGHDPNAVEQAVRKLKNPQSTD